MLKKTSSAPQCDLPTAWSSSSPKREVYRMAAENEMLQSQIAVLGHSNWSAVPGCTHSAAHGSAGGKQGRNGQQALTEGEH